MDSAKRLSLSISKRSFIRIIQDDITNHYEVIKKLGEGSYGKIYKAKNKISGDIRAMKQIDKSKITDMLTFKNEIEILSRMDHPNIIKLFEVFEDNKYFYLINDLCTGGELLDRIVKRRYENPFTEKEAAIIFKQLVSAISYCHDMNIVHRDLKPENILFINEDKNSPIKVIDFGFSKEFKNKNSNSKQKNMSSKVGTVYYMSPEVLQGNYNELCDIWSCGVILYIILCGYPPFQGNNDKEIYQSIQKGIVEFPQKEWKMINKNAKDLILHMLCPANKRYNAKQVLKHVWVNNKAPDSKGELKINIDSLLTFQNSNKLRKVVLTFIASRLRDEEVKNIKNIFSRMDKDKKGTLTLQELKTGLEESLSPEDNINIEQLFESIDTDHSGRIDYTEFIAATMDQKLYLKEEKLYEAFNAFDHDSTGKISIEDIKKFLNLQDNSENDDMIQHWIKENDSNGDGVVDFNEFKKMMTK